MSAVPNRERLSVPESLKQQMHEYQVRVWSTQMLAALAFATAGVLLAFLTVFLIDRVVDTPRSLRWAVLLAVLAAWLVVPWALYRWVWCHRKLDQLARLLRLRQPSIGDQLLSVIELAESDYEQARSRTLCAAAFSQVAEAVRQHDLKVAAPQSRAATWSGLVVATALVAITLGYFAPEAARNAWARMTAPWRSTPRYTFASVKPIPAQIVVAHGEKTVLPIELDENSRWNPDSASLEVEGLPAMTVAKKDAGYRFEIPPQTETVTARLRVGDFTQSIAIVPRTRPELIAASAEIRLPDYLQLADALERDVRGGTLSVVDGSSARVQAVASRRLKEAAVDGEAVPVSEATFRSPEIAVAKEPASVELTWRDQDGLTGREPFGLAVQPIEDERPSIASQQLPRQAVLLDSEQVNFSALAADDFGVKQIGIAWNGLDDRMQERPAKGEKVIAAGGPNQSSIQAPATFSAKALGIKPQPIEVRLWAEDYLPGRERTYSPPHVFFVLTPEQHAIWITEQLSKWHRASLEVRDREMALHETNKQLRAATPEELASGEMRKQLQRQAAAEADNSRKLAALSKHGEELLRQAARNPEMGVGHLDRWAEMLQILNDIATNRMPSVSDLLAQASTEPRSGKPSTPSEPTSPGEPTSPDKNTSPGKNTSPRTPTSPEKNTLASKPSSPAGEAEAKPAPPAAGMQRTAAAGSGKPPEEVVASSKLTVPQVTDVESSLQPNEPQAADDQPPKKKYDGTRMGLAQTVLSGPARKSDGKPNEAADEQPEDDSTVGKAVWEQEELLAEFERVADELNTVLANLEGSTLVKRLKAAAREQTEVADRIGSRIDSLFGLPAQSEGGNRKVLDALAQAEEASSQKVSYIMDDMQSYFERRRMNQFKFVLDDMRNSDVIGALREIGEKLPAEGGLSIAQTEYWADTLDRWAEDLVDPACAGNCPGAKDSDSLPPSVILEVLQILEGEVNLREATRVAEQAKAANSEEQHAREADGLGQTQEEIRLRTDKVVERIQEMPEGSDRFAKEISLLGGVSQAMLDARDLLMAHDTGSPAMASETDAIELLLQSKRINPKAGGGGGTGPGGGGTGTTQDSALALLGSGLNQNEKREARDVSQATGEAGRVLPEEFRAGLDEYFQRLESGQTGQTGTPPRHEDTTEER